MSSNWKKTYRNHQQEIDALTREEQDETSVDNSREERIASIVQDGILEVAQSLQSIIMDIIKKRIINNGSCSDKEAEIIQRDVLRAYRVISLRQPMVFDTVKSIQLELAMQAGHTPNDSDRV